MPFYCSSYCSFYFALSLVLVFISPTRVHAEYWLSDRLFIDNHQQLLINSKSNNNNSTNLHGQLLPELTITQGLNKSALVFGTKLNLQRHQADATINKAHLRFSPQFLNSFLPEALISRTLITIGRQKNSYTQADLFARSLTKNDDRTDALNYSQGLKIRHRLGFIEQSIFFNQYARSDSLNAPVRHHGTETHYQLKVGVPGYIVGPAILVIEAPSQRDDPLRAILGSALQFPLRIVPGDWQWAFQYASELSDSKPSHRKQKAWQTSVSWLGFIPQHKVGMLFSHSDDGWIYSDDFESGQDRIEIRYQWTVNQRASVEWALSESSIDMNSRTKAEKALHGRFTFAI